MVHPVATISDDWLLVLMSVRGHLAVLYFKGFHSLSQCQWWFPSAVPTVHKAESLHMSLWEGHGVERERVAIWAAVASLSRLSSALVFDRKGIRADLVEIAYDMAREMIVSLAPKPHQKPGDPGLDFRTHSARRYDDGFDVEGGDNKVAQRLEKAAFQTVEARRRKSKTFEAP